MPNKRDARVNAFLERAQRREDAAKARRLRRIARAHSVLANEYMDSEIAAMEQIVAGAYGRLQMNKL